MTGQCTTQAVAEPVVGVYGLRTFLTAGSGALLPVTFDGARRGMRVSALQQLAWTSGRCAAVCLGGAGHKAPADDCRCGVYSMSSLAELLRQYGRPARRIIATIALEGYTVEGARGYRSAAARVSGLWMKPLPRQVRDAVAARYPDVPVFGTVPELVADPRYPQLWRDEVAMELTGPGMYRANLDKLASQSFADMLRMVTP